MAEVTAEQQARDLLERLEYPNAQELTSGDVVELANLIAERDQFKQIAELNADTIKSMQRPLDPKHEEILRENLWELYDNG